MAERLPLVAVGMRPDGSVEPALELDVRRRGDGEVEVAATCTANEPVEAGVRVELRLEPTDDPRWLIPGVFYGDNRPENCTRIYPRFAAGRSDVGRMGEEILGYRGFALRELAAGTRRDNVATFPEFSSADAVPRIGVSVGLATIAGARRTRLVLHGREKRVAAERLLALDEFDPSWPAGILRDTADGEIWLDWAALP